MADSSAAEGQRLSQRSRPVALDVEGLPPNLHSQIGPEKALDGKSNGNLKKGGSIAMTNYGDNQWWMVDLGGEFVVSKVIANLHEVLRRTTTQSQLRSICRMRPQQQQGRPAMRVGEACCTLPIRVILVDLRIMHQ
jgi:hypothetical protein